MARPRDDITSGDSNESFRGNILDRRLPSVPAGDVTKDLTDLGTARLERTTSGLRLFTSAVVEDVRGGGESLLWNAMNAAGIPRFGELHRFLNLPVNRLEAQLLEGHTKDVLVNIEYGVDTDVSDLFDQNPDDPNAPPRLEVSSTMQPARTEFELVPGAAPKPIVVTFNRPVPGEADDVLTQTGSVEFMVPMSIVRFYRRERADPLSRARGFIGHVNKSGVFGDPTPHWWLITRLDGVTVDRGATWNVTYEFQQNRSTWDPDIAFIDDTTGRRHKDATVENGGIRESVPVLPEVEFERLRLFL